jgi:hypothetical protein
MNKEKWVRVLFGIGQVLIVAAHLVERLFVRQPPSTR